MIFSGLIVHHQRYKHEKTLSINPFVFWKHNITSICFAFVHAVWSYTIVFYFEFTSVNFFYNLMDENKYLHALNSNEAKWWDLDSWVLEN